MVGDDEADNLARAVPPSEQVIAGWGLRVVASFPFLAEADECHREPEQDAGRPGQTHHDRGGGREIGHRPLSGLRAERLDG